MKRATLIVFTFLAFASCNQSPPLLWRFKTNGPIYSSPAVAGSNLVVASMDGFLYALNLQSGQLVWKQNIGTASVGTPLVRGNLIYVGGGKGEVFCLDAATGNIRWQFHTGNSMEYCPCADDSGIYFGSRDYSFYKISYSGNKIWSYKTTYYLWGTCAFYKNFVLTSAWDFHIYAFDRTTGNVGWKYSAGIQIYGSPEIVKDQVYFATHGKLYRLDANTGNVLGQATTGYLDEVTFWNGFLWTNDGGLKKRTLDGAPITSLSFNTTAQVKPVATGKYIVLAGDNVLYGISPEMKILWKFKAEDDFWRAGIVANDTYYIGNRDFYVYAVRLP